MRRLLNPLLVFFCAYVWQLQIVSEEIVDDFIYFLLDLVLVIFQLLLTLILISRPLFNTRCTICNMTQVGIISGWQLTLCYLLNFVDSHIQALNMRTTVTLNFKRRRQSSFQQKATRREVLVLIIAHYTNSNR